MYTVTWCFFFNPSALPSFPPFPTPSSPTHPSFRLHACSFNAPLGPKLPPACFARRWSPKKKRVETPDRPFWGSRVRRGVDASTGCVRTDHVSLHSGMYALSRQSRQSGLSYFHGGHKKKTSFCQSNLIQHLEKNKQSAGCLGKTLIKLPKTGWQWKKN